MGSTRKEGAKQGGAYKGGSSQVPTTRMSESRSWSTASAFVEIDAGRPPLLGAKAVTPRTGDI